MTDVAGCDGCGGQQGPNHLKPEETSLNPLIEANLDALLEDLRERNAPLRRFVDDEFREYVRCVVPGLALSA